MSTLTLQLSFFAHCTNEKLIKEYVKDTRESIFLAIELSKMSYTDIIDMPVDELSQYVKWKIKFDKDRNDAQLKSLEKMKK